MENEQTNKTDTQGKAPDKDLAPDGKPLSDYDKALALVKRREEATKAEEAILERKEKLAANAMLGGTSGGNVELKPAKEDTPEEYVKKVMKGEIGDEKQ